MIGPLRPVPLPGGPCLSAGTVQREWSDPCQRKCVRLPKEEGKKGKEKNGKKKKLAIVRALALQPSASLEQTQPS